MPKTQSKILVWALIAAMANLPWEAAADFGPGTSGAAAPSMDTTMPPQNVPAQATTPASLDEIKYIGSFADVFQQLQKFETAAIAAMIEEKSFQLKAQTLYGLFINRLMESEWFAQIVQEKGAAPSIPTTIEAQKVVPESPKIIPEPQAPNTKANSAKYESLLEKLGLPSEANEDALLATVAAAMQENGQKLKPVADQRNTAEKKVNTLLTTLQSLAKTEDEKTLALGADAIVHIRRYSGFPMRAIDSAIRDNPQCAGDLFKDHDLFKYLSAMVANKKDGITKGALAVAKVLNCADMVQTLALDSGITLEWIRLNENFAAAQYDTARNRIREWLFGMALMIGDVHQVAGMTGAQALVQLAGDTSLVGPGSWLVRDGVFFINSSSGAMDFYALREEPYVPQPPTPPTPLQLGTNIEMSGPDQSTLLKQAVEGTSKKAPGSAKAMVLKNFKPPEYLDLTTPFGFSFRELQKSCEWHAPIAPATGTPPRYSIMDFIVSAAPDHVGMGLCSKAEMFANGGYCKRIVCEAPEQFFAPSAPPMEGIPSNQTICSLPMPGLMSACEVGQQVSKEIHALAAGDDSCPANPWREGEDDNEPKTEPKEPSGDDDDKDNEDENNKDGESNNGPPPPQECKGLGCKLVGTEGDKQIWETSDGDIIIHIVVKSTGDNGTPEVEDVNEINRTPGGGNSGDESGDSGDPISRVIDAVSDMLGSVAEAIRGFFSGGSSDDSPDDRVSSKDPNVITYGSAAARLPGDGGRGTTDAKSPGGATKPGISVWSKMLDKLNPNPVMAKILGKFKFNKAAKKATLFEWDEFSNCAYAKDPMMCDVITAYTEAYTEAKLEQKAWEKFAKMPETYNLPVSFNDVADVLVSDINTFDDVEHALRVIFSVKNSIQVFRKSPKHESLNEKDSLQFIALERLVILMRYRLEDNYMYKMYKEQIIKRANDVLSDPKFASVAHQSFALAYGIKTTDVDFYIAFTKAIKKARDDALKITSFVFGELTNQKGEPVLGLASRSLREITLSLPVGLEESDRYKGVKLRDVLTYVQVHEMLHFVAFNLQDTGYAEAKYPGLVLDSASHLAMFYISLEMKHSIDNALASHLLGPGYSDFDHLLYYDNHGEHVPPQKKGSGGVGGFFGKDCTPDAPCGGCQFSSHKAAMAAKCSGALNIKNPLTPYVMPNPQSGGATPADNAYAVFMNCMSPGSKGETGVASDKCLNISCGDPANSAHECCASKGKADPSALKLQELFLKQCAAVKCVEGSTDPCCSGFAKPQDKIDIRNYAPYADPQRSAPTRDVNPRSETNPRDVKPDPSR